MIKFFCRKRNCCKIMFILFIVVALVKKINNLKKVANYEINHVSLNTKIELNLKYILLWTPEVSPLDKIVLRGRDPFIKHQCKYTNCYLTHDRTLKKQTEFDAIVFSINTLNDISFSMPTARLPKQKYVASSTDHPIENNVLNPEADNFFNWTWTFKLNSDILWRHFKIYNKTGNEIGPKENIKWLDSSEDISDEVEDILFEKTKGVVWYVTQCDFGESMRNYIRVLDDQLYSGIEGISNLDILGDCSFAKSCGDKTSCIKRIRKDYQFLIAFENYVYRDYVSENILIAMQHFAIPIVFQSELYSSFLPPGSYLDAAELAPDKMALEIKNILDNYALFKSYFKWTNNYYYKSPESEICNICSALNDKQKLESIKTYKEFRKWWNGEETQNNNDMILSLIKNNEGLQKALLNKNFTEFFGMLNSLLATNIFEDTGTMFFNFSTTDALYGGDTNIMTTIENFDQG